MATKNKKIKKILPKNISKSENKLPKKVVISNNKIKTLPKIPINQIISSKSFKDRLDSIVNEIEVDISDIPEELLDDYYDMEDEIKPKLIKKNWLLWSSIFIPFVLPSYIKGMSGTVELPPDAKQSVLVPAPAPKQVTDYAKQYFTNHGLELVKTLTQTDCERLKIQMLNNWGMGEDKFASSFKEDYANSKSRLETIYRTEKVKAENEGIMARAKNANHTKVIWNCALDERSCEICSSLQGQVTNIGEVFEGTNVTSPPIHPSCRCVLTSLTEEDYDELPDEYIRQDAAYLHDVADFIKLNYKCEFNGTDNKCGLDLKFGDKVPEKLQSVLNKSEEQKMALSNREQTAINNYKHFNYQEINGYLRDPTRYLSEDSKEDIQNMDNAFNKISMPDDMVVYSGLRRIPKDVDLKTIGNVFTVPEYTSSSILPQSSYRFAQSSYMLEIEIPKGSKALYVGSALRTNEKEVLINHGSTYEVIGLPEVKTVHNEFGDNNIKVVKVRLVNDNKKKQDAAYLSDIADQMKLNYKCPEGSHDEGFGCGGEGKSENTKNKISVIEPSESQLVLNGTRKPNKTELQTVSKVINTIPPELLKWSGDLDIRKTGLEVVVTSPEYEASPNHGWTSHAMINRVFLQQDVFEGKELDHPYGEGTIKHELIHALVGSKIDSYIPGGGKSVLTKENIRMPIHAYDSNHNGGSIDEFYTMVMDRYEGNGKFNDKELAKIEVEKELGKGKWGDYLHSSKWSSEELSKVKDLALKWTNDKSMLDTFLNKERKLQKWEEEDALLQQQDASYLNDVASFMKLNYNCPDSEKTGSGPGSCSNGQTNEAKTEDNLTLQEKQVVDYYQRTGYGKMNAYLRNNETNAVLPQERAIVEGQIKLLENTISKSKLYKELKVFKGVDDRIGLYSNIDNLVGTTVTDPGFCSTSMSVDIAAQHARSGKLALKGEVLPPKGIIAVMKLPQGTEALEIGQTESEVLVQHGTSFKVTAVDKSGPYWRVDMEAVPSQKLNSLLADVADFMKLNYKCRKEDSPDGSNKCNLDQPKDINVDITVPTKASLETMIRGDPKFEDDPLPFDDDYNIKLGDTIYQVRLEGWFDDCLESRGYDVDESEYQDVIKSDFKQIVSQESGWGESKENVYGYVPDVPGTTYGVTYIGRPIKKISRNEAYLDEVTGFIKLNRKCKAGTFDESNKCGPEKENTVKDSLINLPLGKPDFSGTAIQVSKDVGVTNETYRQELGNEVTQTLDKYRNTDYIGINSYLRTGNVKGQDENTVQKQISLIDSAFTKKTSEPITTFRVVRGQDIINKYKQGNEVSEKAYLSTTISGGVGFFGADSENALSLQIEVPKGTPFVDVSKAVSGVENELLLPRNGTLKIIEVKEIKQQIYNLDNTGNYVPSEVTRKYARVEFISKNDNSFQEVSTSFNAELGGFHTTDYKTTSDKPLRVISQDKADNPKVLEAIKDIEPERLPSQFLVMKMKEGTPAKYYAKTDSIGVDKSLSSAEMSKEIKKVLDSMKTNGSYLNEVSDFIKLNYRCEENPPGSGNFKCDVTKSSDKELDKVNKNRLKEVKTLLKEVNNHNNSIRKQMKEHPSGSPKWKELQQKLLISKEENLEKQRNILSYKHPTQQPEFDSLIKASDNAITNLSDTDRNMLSSYVFGAGNTSYQQILQRGNGSIPTPEEYANYATLRDNNQKYNEEIYQSYLRSARSSIKAINTIDNIINNVTIDKPITVYAGIGSRIYNKIGPVGSEFTIPQFLSTSKNEKVAKGFADLKWHANPDISTVLELRVKPGSKGLALENFAVTSEGADAEWVVGSSGKKGVGSQAEVLLSRNIKCTVIDIQKEVGKPRKIIVEASNNPEIKRNASYLQEAATYLILQDAAQKLNTNCKDEEKVGSGPGSCSGGNTANVDKVSTLKNKIRDLEKSVLEGKFTFDEAHEQYKSIKKELDSELEKEKSTTNNNITKSVVTEPKPIDPVKAFSEYQNYAYTAVNDYLRQTKQLEQNPQQIENIKNIIKTIDSEMKTSKLDSNTLLYRADGAGISVEAFENTGLMANFKEVFGKDSLTIEDFIQNPNIIKELNNRLVGYEYTEKAYTSTGKYKENVMNRFLNPSRNINKYGVVGLVTLSAPKGTTAIRMVDYTGLEDELGGKIDEYLLDRNQTIVIDNVFVRPSDDNRLYLEYRAHIKEQKQNSALLSEVASFILLNRQGKCPRGTVDDSILLNDAFDFIKLNYGTPEGARKAWDTRGRGRKEEHAPTKINIHESKSFKQNLKKLKSGNKIEFTNHKGEDLLLSNLVNEVGFDKLPKIESAKNISKRIKNGDIELFRGVSSKDFVNEFKYGKYFAGKGTYGNGIYATVGKRGITTALEYSNKSENSLIRMALSKDAKVISDKDLRDAMSKIVHNETDTEISNLLHIYNSDPGKWALMNGYDAISLDWQGYMIILNRGKLTIQQEEIPVSKYPKFQELDKKANDLYYKQKEKESMNKAFPDNELTESDLANKRNIISKYNNEILTLYRDIEKIERELQW